MPQQQNIKERTRDMFTYHADDGTSGYELTEKQFEKIDQLIDLAIKEIEEEKKDLANALINMYYQYCGDGHCFMCAGEEASDILEKYGYAKFDRAGRIISEDKQHQTTYPPKAN